jgi:ribonuclease J
VWPLVRVYVAQRQRVRIKQAGEFHRAAEVKPYRLFSEDLAAAPERYVVYGAFSSEVARFVREGVLTSSSAAIWSLWDGYLVEPSGKRLEARLSSIGLELIHHHTSGHASSVDLKRLVDAIGARRVVPIHTQHGAAMVQVGLGTYAMSDGEQWEVGYGQ